MSVSSVSAHVTLEQVNELAVLRIKNAAASASIAIQGAHIFEYCATGREPMLFVSSAEPFKKGSAIRGGIPVCWPWFGPHSFDKEAPAHGFVRNVDWEWEVVSDTEELTEIRFTQQSQGKSHHYPFQAKVELLARIGNTLEVSLTTTNLGKKPLPLSQALHTYFNCKEIENVRLHGFEGFTFVDSLTDERVVLGKEMLFDQEVDGVVLDQGQELRFAGLGQGDVTMARTGSRSVVVWNPWIAKSITLGSFNDDDYLRMFCVETTNTDADSRILPARGSHTMSMTLAN